MVLRLSLSIKELRMKIIFHDTGTDLMTLFATQLYLNIEQDIKFEKIKKLTLANQHKTMDPTGTINYLGVDCYKNHVFIMGRKKEKQIVCKALRGLSRILKFDSKINFFDLGSYQNIYLKLATLLKFINIPSNFIQRIIFYGIQKEFNELNRDIKKFKNKLGEKK
jgi:hypothetical protein